MIESIIKKLSDIKMNPQRDTGNKISRQVNMKIDLAINATFDLHVKSYIEDLSFHSAMGDQAHQIHLLLYNLAYNVVRHRVN